MSAKTYTARDVLHVHAGANSVKHSEWQRGANASTNRALRQYFPKGASMSALTQYDLDLVAAKLNARPRTRLNFETPATRFEALLRRPIESTRAHPPSGGAS